MRDLALFRRAELVAALLEQLPCIVIRDFGPLSDRFRGNRDKDHFAIFGRAELDLVLVEIGGQRFRRRRLDGAGLRRLEFDIVDRPLLVLEAAQRLDHDLRRFKTGRNGAGDLTPQRHPPLVGDIALLAIAELPDRSLEACGIEGAVGSLEIGIAQDHAPGFGVGLPEPEPLSLFVERGLGNGLLQHLPVKPEGAGLFRGQRAAKLPADLLQLLGVELAELSDRDFGVADRGHCRLSETPEDIGDAPDAETDDQHAHHHGHDGFAEPV